MAQTKVAVLSDAAARGYADLVEVALATTEGLAVLERARIAVIEAEIGLSALASDPAASLKAGGLLGADLVAWIATGSEGKNPRLLVRVSAVKSGVVILATSMAPPAGNNDPELAALCTRVAGIRAKAHLERDLLIPVSMLTLRSAVGDAAGRRLEAEMTSSLEAALSTQPDIAVLERRRLPALEFERLLSWDKQSGHFWTCSVGLDGNISYPQGTDDPGFRLELVITVPGRERDIRLGVNVPDRTKLPEAAGKIAAGLAKQLSTERRGECWTAAREGAWFLAEARSALGAGRFQEAMSSADISVVLGVDPGEPADIVLRSARMLCEEVDAARVAIRSNQKASFPDNTYALLRMAELAAAQLADTSRSFDKMCDSRNGTLGPVLKLAAGCVETLARSGWMERNPEQAGSVRAAFHRLLDALLGRWEREIAAQKEEWRKNQVNEPASDAVKKLLPGVAFGSRGGTQEEFYLRILAQAEASLPRSGLRVPHMRDLFAEEMDARVNVWFWNDKLGRPDAERHMAFGDRLAAHASPFFRHMQVQWMLSRWLADPDAAEYGRLGAAIHTELSPRDAVAYRTAAPATPAKPAPSIPVSGPMIPLETERFWEEPPQVDQGQSISAQIEDVRLAGDELHVLVVHARAFLKGAAIGKPARIQVLSSDGQPVEAWELPAAASMKPTQWDLGLDSVAYDHDKVVHWRPRVGGDWREHRLGFTVSQLRISGNHLYLVAQGVDSGLYRVDMATGSLETLFSLSRKPAQTSLDNGGHLWLGVLEFTPEGTPAIWVQRKVRSASWHVPSGRDWAPFGKESAHVSEREYDPSPTGIRPHAFRPVPGGHLWVQGRLDWASASMLSVANGYEGLFRNNVEALSKKSLFRNFYMAQSRSGRGQEDGFDASRFHPGELFVLGLGPDPGRAKSTETTATLHVSPPDRQDWQAYALTFAADAHGLRKMPLRVLARRDDLLLFSRSRAHGNGLIHRISRDKLRQPAP